MDFVIPAIFTAVDKLSSVVRGMGNSMHQFSDKASAAVARSERAFRRLTPALSDTGRQLLDMAKSAAIAGGILATLAFSGKALMDYETALANLQAVTGASGAAFETFKAKIQDVAKATKSSSVMVADAFTAIANNQPELLKDAEALAAVTKGAIILAQASKMELKPAGEALTQILNQFGKGALEAAKTVDILAAGSVAGSSEISDTAAALQKFGTVAANAGVKINESVALIELGSKFDKGTEAGEKFKNILLTMSTIKVQDPKALADLKRLHVNLSTVSNAALPLNTRLREMSKISKDNAALFHVFGKENIAMATGVLTNAAAFSDMVDAVNTTGMAASMAAKNNDTLSVAIDQAKAAWVNMLTSTDQANGALQSVKQTVQFLTGHMAEIVSVGLKVIAVFAAWKAINIATSVAIVAYNVVLGISTAIAQRSAFYVMGNTVAYGAYRTAVIAGTAAQWLLNAAMDANPIGAGIIALGALIALVYIIIKKWDDWGAALVAFMGPIGWIISAIMSIRDNWRMVVKAFSEGSILDGLKAIGALLLDVILKPLQTILMVAAKLPGAMGDAARSAADKIADLRHNMGLGVDPETGTSKMPAVNGKQISQQMMVNQISGIVKQSIDVNIKLPQGVDADVKNKGGGITPRVSSTLGM